MVDRIKDLPAIEVRALGQNISLTTISLLFSDHRNYFRYEFHLLNWMRYFHP